MTKSCATHQGPGRDLGRGAALALQGGGAHGAFTWGVLDRLVEEELQIDAICGVPSGALIAVMPIQGMVRDGPAGARAAMREYWTRSLRRTRWDRCKAPRWSAGYGAGTCPTRSSGAGWRAAVAIRGLSRSTIGRRYPEVAAPKAGKLVVQ
jgi:predicted acylesterase/phospholipase RssA